MRRLYCPPENIDGSRVCLDDKSVHYIKDVLRLKKGAKIEIFDGKGNKYNCVLQDLNSAKIISKEFSLAKESSYRATLAQAIPNKPSKIDFIIEKATELGVDAIILVAAARSIQCKGIAALPLNKLRRWQKIASEASRQSGRSNIPDIKFSGTVNEALSLVSDSGVKLFACIDKGTLNVKEVLKGIKGPEEIAVFIGPEGDFAPEEIESARQKGFKLISLGERVLRTETAGLYVLSILDYVFG